MLFALVVTASVQLVGVYLVFTSLIVPAVATYRHAPKRQLMLGYALGDRQLRRRDLRVSRGHRSAVEPGDRVGDGHSGIAGASDRSKRARIWNRARSGLTWDSTRAHLQYLVDIQGFVVFAPFHFATLDREHRHAIREFIAFDSHVRTHVLELHVVFDLLIQRVEVPG